MPESSRSGTHPGARTTTHGHDQAFAVADRLAVHGAQCVCPRCAGRLPGLLTELARALDGGPTAR